MIFPVLNRRAASAVNISDFSGGVNLRDGLSEIMDNQATNIKNMWWKDGIMKTRPADICAYSIPHDGYKPLNAAESFTECRTENVVKMIAGRQFAMLSRHNSYFIKELSGDALSPVRSHISFAWINGAENYSLPAITSDENSVVRNYFAVQHKKDIFCFVWLENISGDRSSSIYRLKDDESVWERLSERDIYAPLIASGCKTLASSSYKSDAAVLEGATLIEGYNLIGHRCKFIFSTVNRELFKNGESQHEMMYAVIDPGSAFKLVPELFEVIITDRDGIETKHTATVKDGDSMFIEDNVQSDGLKMTVGHNGMLWFNFSDSSGSVKKVTEDDFVLDNMVVFSVCENNVDEKVFGMTQTVWFGGDALGISGGTRLFLGGNTETEETNLVLWSGLDNPLYFPENCYAYIGNSKQAVTAFGRQNDTLVIFKERETYYTQYTRNSDISADDLINQSIVDYTASNVYFPIVQLHPAIGCDCPDTVQLCRNRLVWCCTDGNVYTLMTQNQYSERNIYSVSEMVKPSLAAETGLAGAFACDWEGHYLLCTGSRIYAMDYESYGYTYASSYGKTEDANLRIPWWIWEIKNRVFAALVLDGSAVLCRFSGNGIAENISSAVYRLDAEAEKDYDGAVYSAIESGFTSKLFDFGSSYIRKNIDGINVVFGNNRGEPINVKVITDAGTEEHTVTLEDGDNGNRQAGYTESRLIMPSARQVTRLAVGFSCKGRLAIDGMSIKYRHTGGIR